MCVAVAVLRVYAYMYGQTKRQSLYYWSCRDKVHRTGAISYNPITDWIAQLLYCKRSTERGSRKLVGSTRGDCSRRLLNFYTHSCAGRE